uniref:Uncharacterized protein n=1 Tax=Peronospora matthiolae TaxID=2874970 RepID=A0AAV1TYU0_9STRA
MYYRKRFYQHHGITHVRTKSESYWKLNRDSKKYSGLESLVSGWYGFAAFKRKIRKLCQRKQHHTVHSLQSAYFDECLSIGAIPFESMVKVDDRDVVVYWKDAWQDGTRLPSGATNPDAQVPSAVVTKRICARVDNTLGCSEQYTKGTIRTGGLRTAFTIAGLNSTSVFLDAGCWYGGPMQLAKVEFGVRAAALSIEVCRYRVTQALLHAKTTKVPLFPVHLPAECFDYYDPATQVFVFGTATVNLALAAIQCAITRSQSV